MLAIIHFYWALGGNWGISSVLPTDKHGTKKLHPKKTDSAIVGCVLLIFSLFYAFNMGISGYKFPSVLFNYFGWIIPGIFLVRAIGDFNYVGFFKKVKYTAFGKKTLILFPIVLINCCYWFYYIFQLDLLDVITNIFNSPPISF